MTRSGPKAADDRGHVGDQPFGDQIAVSRYHHVACGHGRIGSWRRDQVDVDERGTRAGQECLDFAPGRRAGPVSPSARAVDAVADEQREVDVDRAERLEPGRRSGRARRGS